MKEYIEKLLFEKQDPEYRLFQAKLMPGVDIERIIGVRTPELRKMAKLLCKEPDIDTFLTDLPHKFYDMYNLHGFIISECKDYNKTVWYVNALLPYVDNWATCDLLSPKSFKKNRIALKTEIKKWLCSKHPFTVSFGIEMIMTHFLDEDFDPNYLKTVSKIKSEHYYIKMMIAWYFATALAKQWEATVPYLESKVLPVWVHNKTIQKANESYRISDTQKEYLKTFKIKQEKAK